MTNRSHNVRVAAAQTAVAASRNTGRPVDPRVQQLADNTPDDDAAGQRAYYAFYALSEPDLTTVPWERLTDFARRKWIAAATAAIKGK